MQSNKLAVMKAFLLREYWFSSCAESFQDALLNMGGILQIAKNDYLYRSGVDDGFGLFCVLDGSISVVKVSDSGEESIVVYLEPYHWFGELPLIDGKVRGQNAVANETTSVLTVPRGALKRWLTANPNHWQHIANLCAYKLRLAYDVVGESGAAKEAVARRLVYLCHGYGSFPDKPRDYISISQEKLSLILNFSRISVNRALAALEDCGAIRCQYGGVKITNLELLKKISGVHNV